MLVISKNDISHDNLDKEDLEFLKGLDDSMVVEILDGDESIQHSLGEAWELHKLASFEPGDRLVSSYINESDIPFQFEKKQSFYSGEFIYVCI